MHARGCTFYACRCRWRCHDVLHLFIRRVSLCFSPPGSATYRPLLPHQCIFVEIICFCRLSVVNRCSGDHLTLWIAYVCYFRFCRIKLWSQTSSEYSSCLRQVNQTHGQNLATVKQGVPQWSTQNQLTFRSHRIDSIDAAIATHVVAWCVSQCVCSVVVYLRCSGYNVYR